MSLRYVVRALLVAGFMPSAAFALGLGEIHLRSALNAPLEADIDLSATPEELDTLKVGLASRDAFTRYGLDYPAFLGTVELQPAKDAAGHDILKVRSRDAATEPFATLLIEANWARGRLVREYTVLLDPPTFTGATGSPASVAAPSGADTSRAASVQRPSPASQAPSSNAPANTTSSQGNPQGGTPPAPRAASSTSGAGRPGSYEVRRGDSLSAIVARYYPNGQRDRALVAAFQANPSAFQGNMNVLRAGANLQLPDDATVSAISAQDASGEVLSQYRAWSPAHPGGQLKLVAPSEPAPAPAPSTKLMPAPAPKPAAPVAATKPAAPASAGDAKRLMELRNPDLASLQQKGGKPAPAPLPAPAPTAAAKSTPAPAPAPAKVETQPEPPAPAPASASPPAAAKPVVSTGGGLLGLLTDYWMYVVGALVLVFGGLMGLRFARSRQDQHLERTFERFSSPPPEPAPRSIRPAETQPIKTLSNQQEQGMVVEETGSHEVLQLDPSRMAAPSVAADAAVPFDSTVSLEQGDPMAEADFHMAYGLYDQAADIVRLGITREPNRRDLKLKLLEVYFVWGNKDQFLQLARELGGTRAQAPAGEWEKVVIMGRQIAADDPLFTAGGTLGGAASGGVDLNLEGGQNHVDFDLLGEPSIAAEPPPSVDLDLGALPAHEADTASTGEAPGLGDTGVDFILDDPARGADGTGSTHKFASTDTLDAHKLDITAEANQLSADAPTVEQLRPEMDHGTLRQKLDATTRAALAGNDQTAELALDDLGLDVQAETTGLNALPSLGSESDSAPTLIANMNNLGEPTRETREMPSVDSGASGTWLLTDKDFSEVMPDLQAAAENGGDGPTQVMSSMGDTGLHLTSQIQALKSGGAAVDHDLMSLDAGATGSLRALDLDLGTANMMQPEKAFSDTQRLESVDIPPSPPGEGMEPATMSEVGTKLDLARAYMDMGDPEGARSILEEVLDEGDPNQRREAQSLIDVLTA
ncbi:MAG: hypothetical protein RL684_346 [Pseudomonadota bacterium]